MAGYNPNKKLAMNKGGKVPIKISSHEVYMSPDVKENVKEATGMSDKDFERELSPNSPYNKHAHHAQGGRVKLSPTSMTDNFHRYHSKHYTGGGNMGYAVGGGVDGKDGTSYFKTDEDGNVITPEMDEKMNLLNMSMAKEYKDREDQAAWDDMDARGIANAGKEQYVPNPNDPYEETMAAGKTFGTNPLAVYGPTNSLPEKPQSTPLLDPLPLPEDPKLKSYKAPESVKKAPVTPADDYYKDIEKANKRLTIGGEALTLGKLMWDAAQKYKAMPTSKVAPFLAYERNYSDMEGSMRRDLAQSEATQRRAAKEQGIQSIFNQMASGSDLEGRLKISETIGDKIQQSKSEYADKKQAYETGKAEIESRDALRNAMGAAEFAAQKGQTLGADMGSIYNVAKSGVDTKLAIGAMKGTEAYQLKMNQLYRTATNPYATKADKDAAKAKLKEIGVYVESSGVIVDTPGQKSKDNTAQNIGEGE
jgi:hypothetical protein